MVTRILSLKRALATMSTLFPHLEQTAVAHMPPGFSYQTDFLGQTEESALVAEIATVELRPFEFRGYLGNRRVASFGYRYDFSKRAVEEAVAIPEFLLTLRAKIARFAGRKAEEFEQIGVQEYAAGAGIGWHKDRPQFGEIAGVSLLAAAPMRLRRKEGDHWRRATQIVAPRSVYMLTDAARRDWEHSIPPMDELRYSITFRTLAPGFVNPSAR
jgi:alkylated DNA repair dioxygenase AlkB